MEQGIFDGRRGQKRLKLIEKQREKVLGEFTTEYENSQEMRFLKQEVRWEGTAELTFAMAMRNVSFAWNGLRDYGFLKLCKSWIEEAELTVMAPKDAEAMIKAVLPEAMWAELDEELSSLEIF